MLKNIDFEEVISWWSKNMVAKVIAHSRVSCDAEGVSSSQETRHVREVWEASSWAGTPGGEGERGF